MKGKNPSDVCEEIESRPELDFLDHAIDTEYQNEVKRGHKYEYNQSILFLAINEYEFNINSSEHNLLNVQSFCSSL